MRRCNVLRMICHAKMVLSWTLHPVNAQFVQKDVHNAVQLLNVLLNAIPLVLIALISLSCALSAVKESSGTWKS